MKPGDLIVRVPPVGSSKTAGLWKQKDVGWSLIRETTREEILLVIAMIKIDEGPNAVVLTSDGVWLATPERFKVVHG